MPARHPGVGQPELGVLAAADHVGALPQLVGAAAAVVELQGDTGPGGLEIGLRRRRRVTAVAGRAGLPIVVIRGGRRGGCGRRWVTTLLVAAVVGLTVIRPAVTAAVAGLLVALVRVGRPGRLIAAAVARGAVAGCRRALLVALAPALVVARGAVAGRRRALLVALAPALVVTGRVPLFGRIRGTRGLLSCGTRVVLRTAVLIVVVLVAGPSGSAVARVVGHRWHSWFCGVRLV